MTAHPTLYQRYAEGGHRTLNRSGVTLAVAAGSDPAADVCTFDAPAELKPAVADYYRHTNGVWWQVAALGALKDGLYPLTCGRWKEGGE